MNVNLVEQKGEQSMITKVRLVLVVKKKFQFLSKFEAIKYVANNKKEIQKTWSNNKTPVVIVKGIPKSAFGFKTLSIPESIIEEEDVNAFINFCNEHGFECGEYITGKVYNTKDDRCFMCEMARYKGFGDLKSYNQHIDKPVDCIIYESENFYVTSELGALKYGYLMIVPKQHILSVAQFPKELMPEYFEVCKDVEEILLKSFKGSSVTFMEHGSGPSGLTSHKRSIVHAHTHVVVDFKLDEKYKQMVKLKQISDIASAKDTHYFSYQEGSDGKLYIARDEEVYVQRQYPRQVMAEKLGFAPNQYNWRKHEFKEITDATLFHIFSYLKEQTNARIGKRTKEFVEGYQLRNS